MEYLQDDKDSSASEALRFPFVKEDRDDDQRANGSVACSTSGEQKHVVDVKYPLVFLITIRPL